MSDPAGTVLDLAGLVCPQVVLRLAARLRDMAPGERLTVISTDPLSAIDVPYLLHRQGDRLVSRTKAEGHITFVVERGAGRANPDGTSA